MLHGIWKENMQVKERIYKESTSIGRGIFYQCRFAYNSLMIMDFQIVDRLVSKILEVIESEKIPKLL